MSIEKILEELVDAVKENSELLRGMTAKAKGALDKADTTGKAASGDTTEKKTRATKPKAVSSKEISDATKGYLDVSDDDEYESRKEIVKKIVGKYDVAKVSEIEDPADRIEAMGLLQIAIAGDDPFPKSSRRSRDDDMA